MHCRHCGWVAVCVFNSCLCPHRRAEPAPARPAPAHPTEHPSLLSQGKFGSTPGERCCCWHSSSTVGFCGMQPPPPALAVERARIAGVQRSPLVTRSATAASFTKSDCRHQLFCGHICVKKYQAVNCSFGISPFLFPSPET